ncbi:hypothetical protein JGU66_22875 [Myxococcaceae bacterium JPH2]|nr:hypothetical protein [Myxococcaceae bacterium JPH2]
MGDALATMAAEFQRDHPALSFAALGSAVHAESLDLAPAGIRVTHLPAEQHEALARQYLALNQFAFGGIGVPRWVLSDLYLMPGAVGLVRCPARMLKPGAREHLGLAEDALAVGAAYYAAPSLTPGLFIGVSLLSFLPGTGAGAWVKALTLRMLRATRLRGVAQWDNLSLRVHTRLGALRLVGRVPGGHEYAERTFVYETDLRDATAVATAMARGSGSVATRRIPVTDLEALGTVLARAEAGQRVEIVPPGLDAGHVLLREVAPGRE